MPDKNDNADVFITMPNEKKLKKMKLKLDICLVFDQIYNKLHKIKYLTKNAY